MSDAQRIVVTAAAVAAVVSDPAQAALLPMHHRENPEMLGGEALRRLAHQRGIARSEAEASTDDQLRRQLRIRAYHYAAEA